MRRTSSSARRHAATAIALLAAFGVAGCLRTPPPPPTTDVVGPTGRAVDERPLYCYRTLGAADCYTERVDAPPNRLIRGYEPIAASPQTILE